MKRPKFEAMDAKLVEGDTVVVWKLDRLGRSMDELIEYVIGLGKRGVHVKSLTQDIDTTTAMARRCSTRSPCSARSSTSTSWSAPTPGSRLRGRRAIKLST